MATKSKDVNSGQIVAVPTTVGKLMQGSTDLHHHCGEDYAGPFHSRKRNHLHQWTRVSQSHRSRIVRNALEEPIMRRVLVLPHFHTSTLPHSHTSTLPHSQTSNPNPNPNPPTLQEIAQNLTLKYKNPGSALRINVSKMIQGFRSTLRRSIHKLTILCLGYNAWSSLGWVAEDWSFFTFTFSLVCPFPYHHHGRPDIYNARGPLECTGPGRCKCCG